MDKWFDIDKEGLAKLIAHKGKVFLLQELIQNAWDTNCKKVSVLLEPVAGRSICNLVVEDDDPDGFQDISHAYTLFADSVKKADPTKRGRFNFGEKIVLALCESALIVSTKGAVIFSPDGTRKSSRKRNLVGSNFIAQVRMTREEYQQVCTEIKQIIPPEHVETVFNGDLCKRPTIWVCWEDTLATEIADDEGNLRPTRRKTEIELYKAEDQSGWLYELGIPVVEIGGPWHVNVMQKVPLNLQRDNVRPAYLRELRVSVLNHSAALLEDEDATADWIDNVLGNKLIEPETTRTIVQKRYGDNVVTADPTDPEAMRTATANGYTVIAGRAFTKEQWENIRAAEAIPRAGKLFPTAKPYSDDPNAPPVERIPENEWSPGMWHVAQLVSRLGQDLMSVRVTVRYVKQMGGGCAAAYGPNQFRMKCLDFNVGCLGYSFFNSWSENLEAIVDLILHEFGHEYCSNHLDSQYYKALTRLGAKLALLVRDTPHLLD